MSQQLTIPRIVLYICEGNVLRSPAAELVTNRELERRGLDRLVKAESAGFYDGSAFISSWKSMARQLKALGYDTSRRRLPPREVTQDLLMNAAVILCMAAGQKVRLERFLARHGLPADGKVISTMHGYAGHGDNDIGDPYMRRYLERGAYGKAAEEIQRCVLDFIPKLEELVHNS